MHNMEHSISNEEVFHLRGIGAILDVLNHHQDLGALIEAFAAKVLEVYDCDRVFLLHPLDTTAATFRIPVEATKPAYPGANEVGLDLPVTPEQIGFFETVLATDGAVVLSKAQLEPVRDETPAFRDDVIALPQSAMITALHPRIGKPWAFGLHQCDHERVWSEPERRLFLDMAKRLAETLSNRLLLRDLTENRETLTRTMDQLMRSNAELERFAQVASHDLQEPVRTVITHTQMLGHRLGDDLDENAAELMEVIESGARRIGDLVRDIRAYSDTAARHEPFTLVDMGRVADAALSALDDVIRETGTTIERVPFPVVYGDEAQLTDLLQNLVANAVKFRRSDRDCVIRLTATEGTDGSWRFSVADNGIGIEPQYFERIFVIFRRLHTISAYPGTGVGLAVCKRIVERHGGEIDVHSVPGEGATFSFTLPARET